MKCKNGFNGFNFAVLKAPLITCIQTMRMKDFNLCTYRIYVW